MDPKRIEALIESGRDSAEARLAAGQARLNGGDVQRAIEHLEKAVALKPDYSAAWQQLGRAFTEAGDRDQARRAWTSGLKAAHRQGDKQAEKVMSVWLKRLKGK